MIAVVLVSPAIASQPSGSLLSLRGSLADKMALRSHRHYPGLSIAVEQIPLLRTKPYKSRSISSDHDHNLVKIETYSGTTPLEEPGWFGLNQYLFVNRNDQMDRIWDEQSQQYLRNRGTQENKGSLLQYEIPIKFPKLIRSIIGEGGPGLRVSGYRRISFSGRSSWVSGVRSTATNRQSKFPALNMEQTSRFTIDGNIGSKITVKVDQDSRRINDLENNLQLRYTGEPEEIIQSIEAGNTNLSIGGSNFVGYSQQVQGLFGFKSTARLAGLDLTMIMSQEKSTSQTQTFRAGAESVELPIRDYRFLERTFYYLGQRTDLGHAANDFTVLADSLGNIVYRDSITFLEVFVAETFNQNADSLRQGIALLDPVPGVLPDSNSAEWRRGEYEYKRFRRLPPEQYYFSPTQYWIKLNNRLQEHDVMGVYMEVQRQGGVIDTIGILNYATADTADSDTLYWLKLIKPGSPRYAWEDSNGVSYPFVTWTYEWKNVYDLEVRDIDLSRLSLKIYKGISGAENIQIDSDTQDSLPYVRILGLDQYDLSGVTKIPDNQVDYVNILPYEGFLIFPQKFPFLSNTSFTANPADTLQDKPDSAIYFSENLTDRQYATKYYIWMETSQRRSTYYLGKQNIIEGSEVVKLNGRTLNRGADYTINYEFGEIAFLTEQALDPNAVITVDFQSAELFQPFKKNLYGIQGERPFGSNFNLRFNALYKSVKSIDERPRVGSEPNRTFVWDANFTGNFEPRLFTEMMNFLPLVTTDVGSKLAISGELAQSISNPNLKNKIYMDDFEGIVTSTDLGVRRSVWTISSPPANRSPINDRGGLIWYNPYNQVLVNEIWPNREYRRNEDKVNVLSLRFTPDTTSLSPPESTWAGVMRFIPAGLENQSKSKYLEIWIQINKIKDNPILGIDLGRISEDVNGDGILNTEDEPVGGIYDGILDEGEDTGIDGLFNSQETGYNPTTNPDPNGDDWFYDSNNPDNVDRINGTENNGNDPDRGWIPDTEDLDRSYSLDNYNSYFAFTFDLDDSTYFVPGTESKSGWRLYRIPLLDSASHTEINSPVWSKISYARLWLTGVTATTTISIAEIKLVGNRWESLPYEQLGSGEFFDVAVKNTYDHADYTPPPGVAGTLDRDDNVREAEQSLALLYESIQPGASYYAFRNLFKAEDYTNYGKIDMYVHGPPLPGGVEFFYRVGSDSNNFYEYRTQIYPGWDERNWVKIDFEAATALKLELKELQKINKDTTLVSGNYRLKGTPSFSSIKWLAAGIANPDTLSTITGEVWVDEMLSTDVRKKPGWAMTGRADMVFADVLRLNTSFTKIDTEFHDLRSSQGSGTTSTSYAVQGELQAGKFLPPNWELGLPVSFTYAKSLSIPRLIRGSDVILPDELRDEQRAESVRKGFSIRPTFNKNTSNWLYNLTLKRLNFSYSQNSQNSYSVNLPVNTTKSYSSSFGYDASLRKQVGLPVLKWLSFLPLPKSLTGTKLGLFPSGLRFTGNINRNKRNSVTSTGVVTNTFDRNFAGGIDASLELLSGIPLNYSFKTTRDLRNDSDIRFSLNPKKAKFGIETEMSETISSNWSPTWFKFMSQSFTYGAAYREFSDPRQYQAGTRNISNSGRYGVSGNFNTSFLYDKIFPPDKKPETQPESKTPPDTTQPPKKKGTNFVMAFFKEIVSIPKNMTPISYSYSGDRSFSRNGLLERPSLWYRFGLESETDADRLGDVNNLQSLSDGARAGKRFTLGSGVTFFKNISTTLGYAYSNSTRSGSGEPTFGKKVSFPDLNLRWNKLAVPPLLNNFISTLSYSLRYTHSQDTDGSDRTGEVYTRRTSSSFAPLAGISLSWKGGINSSIRVDKSTTESDDLRQQGGSQTTSIDQSTGMAVTSNYSFSSPNGIKIPIFGRLRFQSTMNISLDVSWRSNERKSAIHGREFNVTSSSSEFTVAPRGSYNFSSQINGGFQARWSDRTDNKTGAKTHSRELGLWVEIKF